MVKEVVRWEAEDGTLFDDHDSAFSYEFDCKKTELVRKHFDYEFYDNCAQDVIDFVEKYTKGWK